MTLLGADGTVLAFNEARDVLAVLPVYVTLNGGQLPSLRLQDGSTLRFGNAVELAGYLNRTAQRAAPYDPLRAIGAGRRPGEGRPAPGGVGAGLAYPAVGPGPAPHPEHYAGAGRA